MTQFSKAMNRIIERHDWGFANDVARKAKLSKAFISRLRRGSRNGVTPKTLARLVRALTDLKIERAELIAAHLKDESCGYYPDLIDIKVRSRKARK